MPCVNAPFPSSSLSTARSVFLSTPMTFARCLPPSRVTTSISVALSTTWAFVRRGAGRIDDDPGAEAPLRDRSRHLAEEPTEELLAEVLLERRPACGPAVLDIVLMLITAGLMASAIEPNVPPERHLDRKEGDRTLGPCDTIGDARARRASPKTPPRHTRRQGDRDRSEEGPSA